MFLIYIFTILYFFRADKNKVKKYVFNLYFYYIIFL